MTKEVHIKKDGTIDGQTIKLGGSHEHRVDWHNSGDTQALVMIDAEDAVKIFSNPPSGDILVPGGGHTQPDPPLILLKHKERENGIFNYHIKIGDNDKVMCAFEIES